MSDVIELRVQCETDRPYCFSSSYTKLDLACVMARMWNKVPGQYITNKNTATKVSGVFRSKESIWGGGAGTKRSG